MSDILYPDNRHRGDRVLQLATQIGMIQGEAEDFIRTNDNNTDHAQGELRKILKEHNYQTIGDMLSDLEKMLPPDQKKHYQDMIEEYKKWNDETKKVFELSIAVGFLGGVMKTFAMPIITILDTGALVAGLDLFTRGWIALLRGDEMGLAMMRGALTTFRALATGVDISETAERVAEAVATAGSVLVVVSVVLDGILLILAAIQGAKQRTALQDAIVKLCGRRFLAAQTKDKIQATNNQTATASAILIYYNAAKSAKQTEDQMKPVLDTMIQSLVNNLKSDLDKITDQSVWKALDSIDSGSSAWRNEDPDLQTTLNWISSQTRLDSTTSNAALELTLPLRAYAYEKQLLLHKLGTYKCTSAKAHPRIHHHHGR